MRSASPSAVLVALALVALSRDAAAEPPPPVQPPVAPQPPGPAPVPLPGPRVAPPAWPSPAEIPPGYAPPPYGPGPPGVAPGVAPSAAPYPYPYPFLTAQQEAAPNPYTLPPPLPRRRRHMGLFVGGVIAVTGGMSAVLLGSYFVASAAGRIDIYCDRPSIPCATKDDGPRMTGGAVVMAIGALAGAAGIPMWLIGSQYVTIPASEKTASEKPTASAVPEVHIGPLGASATLRF